MKQTDHTSILGMFFNRYHHYILTWICLLFIGTSMILTGCNLMDTNDKGVVRYGGSQIPRHNLLFITTK